MRVAISQINCYRDKAGCGSVAPLKTIDRGRLECLQEVEINLTSS